MAMLALLVLGSVLQLATAGGPIYCQPGQSPPQMCVCLPACLPPSLSLARARALSLPC